MKRKFQLLAMISILAGSSVLVPNIALAERDNDRERRHERQQQRVEQRERIEHRAPQRIEQKRPEHVERRQQHAERQQPSHTVRPVQRIEREPQRRVERVERREHRPVINQHQGAKRHTPARSEHRRHVETRQTIHVEPPRHTVHKSYYRVPRQRYYHGIHIHRRYGHPYAGFGFYYRDNDALQWIAFTVLTLAIIDHLDEHQQRMHEQAQIRATTADIGDTIYWQDRHSHGSVTVTDIWYERGRECRELEQSVTSRGRTESSFNTVCQDRSGRWEVARLN